MDIPKHTANRYPIQWVDIQEIVLTPMEVKYTKKLAKVWKQKSNFINEAYKALIKNG